VARPLADEPALDRDPGLQPERTSLAWARTVLGYLVVATVSLKTASISGTAAVASALAYPGVAVVVALRRTPRYGRDLRQMSIGRTRPPVFEVFALSAVTAALALHWLWLSA
jgi:uncharacterized membrane protein YidH (DUF202 family)